jgi:hypothetical protein
MVLFKDLTLLLFLRFALSSTNIIRTQAYLVRILVSQRPSDGWRLRRHQHQPGSSDSLLLLAPRYGPMDIDADNNNNESISSQSISSSKGNTSRLQVDRKEAFGRLVDNVLAVTDSQHIPSLLTKNLELVLSFTSDEGAEIIETVLEDKLMENPNADTATNILEAIDIIITFAEEFVQRTAELERQNKELLGKIIKAISSSKQNQHEDTTTTITRTTREEALDLLMLQEKEHFTPGFLRHIDMECRRIASAPVVTRESTRLLETLRIIQTRVLEELGTDLGEAAQVLGQLIGYELQSERLAVLEAGLTVRGVSFAQDLLDLTTEALIGFQKVLGGADPELIVRVQQIDDRLRLYLVQANGESNNSVTCFE